MSFFLSMVGFIRLVISQQGILVDPTKVYFVIEWEKPSNNKEVRNLLGMVGYYRCHKGFLYHAKPMTMVTHKVFKF